MCRFVPKWSTSFEPACVGVECTLPEVYSKALIGFPNAAEGAKMFLEMNKAPTETFAGYPEKCMFKHELN